MLKTHALSFSPLLSDVSLFFPMGTITAILGPNGSGKTTFFKTIKHIWKPTSGSVTWDNRPIDSAVDQTISFVPQNPHSAFDFSVEDMIRMGRYPDPICPGSLMEETLSLVGLLDKREAAITALSGGERQRAYIGRALISKAPVLLLDEVFTNLDLHHRLNIQKLLKTLATQGKTILMTTHDLAIAQELSDQIAIFSRGQCVASGTYDEVVNLERLQTVFSLPAEACKRV